MTQDIRQTAAMVQMNAQTIANIQKISIQIAELDKQIRTCGEARRNKSYSFGNMQVRNINGSVSGLQLLPPNCEMLLDIIEIMHRQERDQLITKLDEIGIVLTDQTDIGRAPAWPTSPADRSV